MKYLSQNRKAKKSSKDFVQVFNFGIPALASRSGFKTCPNAGLCAVGCYAQSGTYKFSSVKDKYEQRLELTLSDNFQSEISKDIEKAIQLTAKRGGYETFIRIHDSGDFYNRDYLAKWLEVISNFPNVAFYAYTKQISMFKAVKPYLPSNFITIYSFGGKQDGLINKETDRHSMVFESESELIDAGYVNATKDDLLAVLSPSNKIGLVYHGSKAYKRTHWSKVG